MWNQQQAFNQNDYNQGFEDDQQQYMYQQQQNMLQFGGQQMNMGHGP